MTEIKLIHGYMESLESSSKSERTMTEEDYEDHLDYCAAVEAIDEALEKDGMKRARDFAKELGFDF